MRRSLPATAGLAIAALLAGCASPPAADDVTDHGHHGSEHAEVAASVETAGPQPRLVMTYDGGVMVVDAASHEVVADIELDGFTRVSPAGDGRHMLISAAGGWRVLDAGVWTEAHGDHGHSYAAEPALAGLLLEAEEPGHVVAHDGLTTLFDDATGGVTVVEVEEWAAAVEHGHVHAVREHAAEHAHHGVAVAMRDGGLFLTVGDASARTGAALMDEHGDAIAVSDECPGIHGEAALGDLILAGCEDGILMLHDDHFRKIEAPGAFGRIGNAFAADGSTVVLGDFKTDPEAGVELGEISLIDTEAETMTVVDTGSTYTWRGLARGIDGSALVLGADGSLRVFDPETGDLLAAIDAIGAWRAPEQWQEAHPSLTEIDGFAYIADPATSTLVVVDYVAGTVTATAELPHAPNEVAVADAAMPAASGDGDPGHDHDEQHHDHAER